MMKYYLLCLFISNPISSLYRSELPVYNGEVLGLLHFTLHTLSVCTVCMVSYCFRLQQLKMREVSQAKRYHLKYVCMCVCMYVFIYVCMYVCMCMCSVYSQCKVVYSVYTQCMIVII